MLAVLLVMLKMLMPEQMEPLNLLETVLYRYLMFLRREIM